MRSVEISCLARAKCFGFISLWLAFVGLTSFLFFLKGKCMKKSGSSIRDLDFLGRNQNGYLH